MSANQTCRYSDQIGPDYNPTCIVPELKPGRWLDNVIGVPPDSLGELFDEVMDSSSGILYVKNENNHWEAKVNFSAVVVVADPLILNSIHVNEIMTDNSGIVQVNLQATDLFQVGPSVDLAAVQIQSNGVISSSAAAGTSSLFLGNGAGNQISLDPSILTVSGSPDLNLFASNNAVLTANAGSITAQCGTTVDVSAPSGMTVFTAGSGTFFNDGLGTILHVLPNSIALNGAGDLSVTSDNNLNVTATGTVTITSGAGNQILLAPGGGAVVNVTAGTNLVVTNIFSSAVSGFDITTTAGPISESSASSISLTGATSASMTASTTNLSLTATVSDIVLNAGGTVTNSGGAIRNIAGSSGVPAYSFTSDTNSGVFSAGADAVAIACGGSAIMNFDTAQVTPNVVVRVNTDGTAASPAYSWNADTDIGLYRAAANTIGMSTNGIVRKTLDTTTENDSVHLIPTASNTYDLGSAGLPWRNIYSNNLLNVISDAKMKHNIEDLDTNALSLNFINKLSPKYYHLLGEEEGTHKRKIGLLAQDVEKAFNDCGYNSDLYDMVNKVDEMYSLKYDSLIMFLIGAVKELSDQVERNEIYIMSVDEAVNKMLTIR